MPLIAMPVLASVLLRLKLTVQTPEPRSVTLTVTAPVKPATAFVCEVDVGLQLGLERRRGVVGAGVDRDRRDQAAVVLPASMFRLNCTSAVVPVNVMPVVRPVAVDVS